jgi:hypothetical protein
VPHGETFDGTPFEACDFGGQTLFVPDLELALEFCGSITSRRNAVIRKKRPPEAASWSTQRRPRAGPAFTRKTRADAHQTLKWAGEPTDHPSHGRS